jgi:hypothetical protein
VNKLTIVDIQVNKLRIVDITNFSDFCPVYGQNFARIIGLEMRKFEEPRKNAIYKSKITRDRKSQIIRKFEKHPLFSDNYRRCTDSTASSNHACVLLMLLKEKSAGSITHLHRGRIVMMQISWSNFAS